MKLSTLSTLLCLLESDEESSPCSFDFGVLNYLLLFFPLWKVPELPAWTCTSHEGLGPSLMKINDAPEHWTL